MSNSEIYNIKMLNGLVVRDISVSQIKDGLSSGKYLPSDLISTAEGSWEYIKDSKFYKNNKKDFNGWMALFIISFILNIVMLLMMFWQKSRIEQILN